VRGASPPLLPSLMAGAVATKAVDQKEADGEETIGCEACSRPGSGRR
jgi:hypothetical protein